MPHFGTPLTKKFGGAMADMYEYGGAIVVVSKVPTKGKSKTRLIPLLGEEGSTSLAKAMLSDVLLTLDRCMELCTIRKILLYAPGTTQGFHDMTTILDELKIEWRDTDGGPSSWLLMPMESKVDLHSSALGDLLEHALNRARNHLSGDKGSVIFLGMDSPALPLQEIARGLSLLTTKKKNDSDSDKRTMDTNAALICPADDGGYGMLSVPAHADSVKTFHGIPWSHSLTAIAQVKALTDQGIPVHVGTLMHDIDEPQDVENMCKRLCNNGYETTKTILDRSSDYTSDTNDITSTHPPLFHTRQILHKLGLL